MSASGDLAVSYFTTRGACCAESVWLTFAESDGISETERDFGNKLCFAFCGGTGAHELCGAIAGGVLVLGRWFGRTPSEPRNEDLPKYTKALIDAFTERFGHTTCRDLKPDIEPSEAKKVCCEYVRFVAEKVEELLDKGIGDEEDCG